MTPEQARKALLTDGFQFSPSESGPDLLVSRRGAYRLVWDPTRYEDTIHLKRVNDFGVMAPVYDNGRPVKGSLEHVTHILRRLALHAAEVMPCGAVARSIKTADDFLRNELIDLNLRMQVIIWGHLDRLEPKSSDFYINLAVRGTAVIPGGFNSVVGYALANEGKWDLDDPRNVLRIVVELALENGVLSECYNAIAGRKLHQPVRPQEQKQAADFNAFWGVPAA